ncbi:ACT domain-containing protein [Floccifex sp.]|uniref:ACT domain-containing protein n=1 Tax=Floccifex sp. TaxID=2815810 RepID=UPI002A74FD5E|nr:ACT domain-containing protein [Floccifex sp.]MDD7280671.1 ACT domain-containing protein [Erysipelotrichaceae bacterium]MDY2957406.1 ACT domain-containing protein [Floccifex sp.]
MKAIITVIGKDKVGILAAIANECMKANINILDVSQTIVDGFFTMTMSTDFDNANKAIADFAEYMENFGKERNLVIRVMHQDIFDSMHKV